MDHTHVENPAHRQARLREDSQHAPVLGKHVGVKDRDAPIPCEMRQMLKQGRPDALSLASILHGERAASATTARVRPRAVRRRDTIRRATMVLRTAAAPALRLQKGQQVGVDYLRVRGGHAVREILVGLHRPVLQELRR